MVELRTAESRDSDRLWEIRRRAVRAVDTGHYTDEQIAAWSRRGDLPDFPFEAPTQYLVVATDGDTVAGFGGAGREAGEVKALYVDPGAASGVGTALLQRMESVLAGEGHDRVDLEASLNSVPFYHRHGYTRDRMVTQENHGVELEFVRMGKRLDD